MTILLFTSGTTAKSKAVMLCQKNICKNLMSMFSMLYIDRNDVWLSVLPLHHTYECTCGFLGQVYRGTTVAVCEGLRYIAQNLQEAKPTAILMVPVMLELFYKKIMKGLKEDPKKAKKLQTGIKIANALHFSPKMRKKLFKPIHDIFGGRMRLIILGGAPVNPDILKFFQDMGFLCVQGYGLTECAPILALNRDKSASRITLQVCRSRAVTLRYLILIQTASASSSPRATTTSSVTTTIPRIPLSLLIKTVTITQATWAILMKTVSASSQAVRRTSSSPRTARTYSLKRSSISAFSVSLCR